MYIQIDHERDLQNILMYLMVIVHGAVIWSAFVGENYIAIFGVLLVCVAVISLRGLGIPRWYIGYFSATAACYVVVALVNGIGLSSGLNIKTALIVDMNILMAYTCYNINKKMAVTRFVNVVVFFAGISLVFYLIQNIVGNSGLSSVSFLFPYISWGRGHWGYLIYSFTNDIRNYGIFYEPGVYQVLLNIALFFCIFYDEIIFSSSRKKTANIVILILAVITASSTTGLISLGIIMVGLVLKRGKKRERRILFIVLIAFAIVMIDYYSNGTNSIIYTYVISKIEEMQLSNGSYNQNSSGGARMFIFEEAISAMKTNPLFGKGANYLSDKIAEEYWSGFGTGNVLCSTIATKGLVTLLVSIVPIISLMWRNRKSNLTFIVLIAIYFNTVIAQSQLMYAAFVFTAFVSISEIDIDKEDWLYENE